MEMKKADSAALRRAADAVDRRAQELNKLSDVDEALRVAQEQVRVVQGDRRLQEVRVDVMDREVRHHLEDAVPSDPDFVGGPRGPVVPPTSRGWFWYDNTPTWLGWVAIIIALIALVLALIALNSGYIDRAAVRDMLNGEVLPIKRDVAEAKAMANSAKADASQAKADAANAVSIANDAKVAANTCSERCKPAVRKPVVRHPRHHYMPAKIAPAAVLSWPKLHAAVPSGGCIATSDGTAVLRNDPSGTVQPAGKELDRIPNEALILKYPDSMKSLAAHAAACQSWRAEFAQSSLKEGHVNNDGHLIQ